MSSSSTTSHTMTLAGLLGGMLVAIVAMTLVAAVAPPAHGELLADFHAFYCGSRALLHGSDPSLASALQPCEGGTLVPAPLPPYALALLAPIAVLPFGAAAVGWTLVLTVATAALVPTLARLTGCSPLLIMAAVVPAVTLTSIPAGQLTPLLLLSWSAAALALRTNRPVLAGVLVLPGLLTPNVGWAPLLAVALSVPRARIGIALGMLVAIPDAVLTAWCWPTYLSNLHAQALAELRYPLQYSLAGVLARNGVPDATALVVGATQSLLITSLAIAWAIRQSDRRLLVALPIAAAVFGGIYVHQHQLVDALPLAMLLPADAWQRTALVLQSIAWSLLAARPLTAPIAIVAATLLLVVLWRCPLASAATIAVVTCVGWISLLHGLTPATITATAPASVNPSASSAHAWATTTRVVQATRWTDLAHLPSLLGIALPFARIWKLE